MSRIENLKKKRPGKFKEMQAKLEQESAGGFQQDDRLWWPPFDKTSHKGYAVIRFLPSKFDNSPDIAHVQKYNFKGKGGWFNQIALQTIGEKDPVQIMAINRFQKAKADDNAQLKKETLMLLPKSTYYANIYVVNDSAKPENEGKVFIWRMGPQIYKILKEKLQPEFEDDATMDIFSLWEGADFKVKVIANEIPDSKDPSKKVKVPNYEKCEFGPATEFMGGDEAKLDAIIDQTYDLNEFVDKTKIKSFDEQAELLLKVMGVPYNYLSSDAVEETAKAQSKAADLGVSDKSPAKEEDEAEEDDSVPFDVSDKEKDDEEEDDILAAFAANLN